MEINLISLECFDLLPKIQIGAGWIVPDYVEL
jgi:hypothetical protein